MNMMLKIVLVFLGFMISSAAVVFAAGERPLTVSQKVAFKEGVFRSESKILYRQYLDNADYYFKEKLYPEAKELLWKAISLFPDNPDAYINLATINITQENYPSAIRLLQKAKRNAKLDYYQSEILFYNLGLSYLFDKNYPKAIESLEQALKDHREFSQASYYLGYAYLESNDYSQAFYNIFSAEYLFNKEGMLDYAKKAKASLKQIKESGFLDTYGLADIFLQEAEKLKESDPQKAFALLKGGIDLEPNCIQAYRALIDFCLERNAFYEASGYLERLVVLAPEDIDAYLDLALCRAKINDREGAEANLAKAISLAGDDPEVYCRAGLVSIEASDFILAKNNLTQARRLMHKENDFTLNEKVNAAYKELSRKKAFEKNPRYRRRSVSKPVSKKEPSKPVVSRSGNKGFLN